MKRLLRKRALPTLLALAMVISLLAMAPLTAGAFGSALVCSIGSNGYYTLDAALAALKTGETLKLLADINYDRRLNIEDKDVIIDLNGFTLNVVCSEIALYVYLGDIKLLDPANGAFNVIGITGAHISGVVTVTNATATGDYTNGHCGAYVTGVGDLTVTGNVVTQRADSIGVEVFSGGKVTVDGTITVPEGATYIKVGNSIKTKDDYEPGSSKPGYLEYTDGRSYVWVKGTPDQPTEAVCSIGSVQYGGLRYALNAVKTGETIKLLTNINYNDQLILNSEDFTLDLNGFTLNVKFTTSMAFAVRNAAHLKLKDPSNGAFNVTSGAVGVDIINKDASITVTNITSTGENADGGGGGAGVYGELTITGDVTVLGETGTGVYAFSGGKVTVEGTITVQPGGTYIRVGTKSLKKDDHEATSSRPGYLEYTDGTSYVWVKEGSDTGGVTWTDLTADGVNGGVTTSKLTMTFDKDPGALKADDITVTGATKGALTGSGLTRTLAISDITVENGKPVIVSIAGHAITPATKTVAVNVAGEPKITGPASMELTEGYEDESSEAFTVLGAAAPSLSITPAIARITWNEETNKLDIPDGLEAGTYTVVLSVKTALGEAEHTFTLTVKAEDGAESGGMANFKKVNTYTRGQFPDVDETQWYGYDEQKTIALAYEYGLMQGNDDGTFNPGGNVTIAQALAVACRVHVIYSGAETLVQGETWFEVYVAYAITNGMIKATDFAGDYGRPATRAEMVYIFASAVPKEELPAVNTVKSLPDVVNSTPYSAQIFMMYEAGVLTGNDDAGTFTPNANISRAQAAAIIARIILPAERKSGNTYG